MASSTDYSFPQIETVLFAPRPQIALSAELSDGASFKFKISKDTVSIGTDYSWTNIQVEGVDEADIVKTDGKYLYVISKQAIVIILAYPPTEARVLSRIELSVDPVEIFINDDRLMVFGISFEHVPFFPQPIDSYVWRGREAQTVVAIYDISNKEKPNLIDEVKISGAYFDSRMIGSYVYIVVNMGITVDENENVVVPWIRSSGEARKIPPTEIYYFPRTKQVGAFAILMVVDIRNAKVLEKRVVLTNSAHSMYVSTKNIYITYTSWEREGWSNAQKTVIHKIALRSGSLSYEGQGMVPGRVLNQFSMDEYDGFFRIATTIGWYGTNNIYVLDERLRVVGRLVNLAPGERIYSARFMGERAYLVTFKKVDPLFVIDLSDPLNPRVLGELKIPGYSDYLHLYDENHLIGIGKDTIESEWGDFAWYQGVKLALFDVSDPTNPCVVDNIVIGKRGTESYALQDHKAFLFSRARNLLVIPIGSRWNQDAFVFHISPENGIVLRGTIDHDGNADLWDSSYSVKRSLYIEDVLYTISEGLVKLNSLTDLSEINSVELG
jgi:uncharacterized secreted protein with C-terminal beta-propeller domain